MKLMILLFVGSMAFDMIVKNVFPTTNTGDPKEILKQAAPIPSDPETETSHHHRHDQSEDEQYAYLSSENGGVRIVDHKEGQEIDVESGTGKPRRKVADITSVKVLFCTS